MATAPKSFVCNAASSRCDVQRSSSRTITIAMLGTRASNEYDLETEARVENDRSDTASPVPGRATPDAQEQILSKDNLRSRRTADTPTRFLPRPSADTFLRRATPDTQERVQERVPTMEQRMGRVFLTH